VVAAGLTVTGFPLVTGPTPLSTEPVPPEKTAINVVELAGVIAGAPAVKLEITGGGITVSLSGALVAPAYVAVMFVDPPPLLVASPRVPDELLIVATDVLEEFHVARFVTSRVLPSR
jgi:hypothetical protein